MLRKRAHTTEQSVIRLSEKVKKLTQDQGEALDQNFQSDLLVDNQEKVKNAYSHGSKVTQCSAHTGQHWSGMTTSQMN